MDKDAVKKASTTLHCETKTGVKLKGPKKEFVILDRWDPKLDGELDETKAVEEVWRAQGRVGVLQAQEYEDNNISEKTEEHRSLNKL